MSASIKRLQASVGQRLAVSLAAGAPRTAVRSLCLVNQSGTWSKFVFQESTRRFTNSAHILTSSKPLSGLEGAEKEPENTTEPAESQDSQSADDTEVPWYLREVKPVETRKSDVEYPEIPADAPPSLEKILHCLGDDLGLLDLVLIDLRPKNPTARADTAPRAFDFVIISTGKSENHIQRAAQDLRVFLKHDLGVVPAVEGLSKAKTIAMRTKKLKKKILKASYKASSRAMELETAATNNWVLVDTHVDRIVVHMLKEEKREELDLEYLLTPEEHRREMREARQNRKLAEVRKRLEELPEIETSEEEMSAFIYMVEGEPLVSDSTSPADNSSASSDTSSSQETPVSDGSKVFTDSKQTRQFHTSAVRRQQHSEPVDSSVVVSVEEVAGLLEAGQYQKLKQVLQRVPEDFSLNGKDKDELLLESHVSYVRNTQNILKKSGEPAEGSSEQPELPVFYGDETAITKSFKESFPLFPRLQHWQLKYLFYEACHFARPASFPLQMFLRLFLTRQAAGCVLEESDIVRFAQLIADSPQFAQEDARTAVSVKMALLGDVVELFVKSRPLGVPVWRNPAFVAAVGKIGCWKAGGGLITLKEALANPLPEFTPEGTPKLISEAEFDWKLHAVLYMAADSLTAEKDVVGLAGVYETQLVVYANCRDWKRFESVLLKAVRTLNTEQLIPVYTAANSLAAKTGDRDACQELLEYPTFSLFEKVGERAAELDSAYSRSLQAVVRVSGYSERNLPGFLESFAAVGDAGKGVAA